MPRTVMNTIESKSESEGTRWLRGWDNHDYCGAIMVRAGGMQYDVHCNFLVDWMVGCNRYPSPPVVEAMNAAVLGFFTR